MMNEWKKILLYFVLLFLLIIPAACKDSSSTIYKYEGETQITVGEYRELLYDVTSQPLGEYVISVRPIIEDANKVVDIQSLPDDTEITIYYEFFSKKLYPALVTGEVKWKQN